MTGKRLTAVMLWLSVIFTPSVSATDVIVVCPQKFSDAIGPWLRHRRSEGLSIRVLPSQPDAEQVRSSIVAASDADTRYVLLVGDAPVVGAPCNELVQTPILYAPTSITKAWGSTPTLSTDLLYGDLDGDRKPEAVVGRLPVDQPQQLEGLVRRIVARDTSDDFGTWRSQVQLVGGVGGFGALVDATIETVTRSIVTSVLPDETKTTVYYASPGHPFFPTGKPFTDAVIDRYQQGARFWVYAGHGQITHLDRVPNTLSGTPVLDHRSVQRLRRPPSCSPIALMLSCYTGALDAAEDSIAEQMLLCEGGPIAVLAGSRVTMPYGNTTAAIGLIDGVYRQQLPRLGDAWLNALVQMHEEASDDTSTTRVMVDGLATIISPAGTRLVDERREHMMLYNLIGDPTLRLHHPRALSVEVQPGYETGQPIVATIESPIDGRLCLSVDRPLGGVTDGDPNETTVALVNDDVRGGHVVRQQLDLPAGVKGPLLLRAFVSGKGQWAAAAARTIVRDAQ